MKLTELIARLNAILVAHGDLDVTCWPYDGQGVFCDLVTVKVLDTPEYADIGGSIVASRKIINLDA